MYLKVIIVNGSGKGAIKKYAKLKVIYFSGHVGLSGY